MGHARATQIVFTILFALTLFVGAPVIAQTPSDPQPTGTGAMPSETVAPRVAPSGYGALLFQLVIVVVGVCLLAYLILRFGVKRFLVPDSTEEGAMEVVARLPLEPRRSVVVVRVGSRHIIVGSSENGLSSLGELSDEELHYFDREPAMSPFAKLLRRKMSGKDDESGEVVDIGIAAADADESPDQASEREASEDEEEGKSATI